VAANHLKPRLPWFDVVEMRRRRSVVVLLVAVLVATVFQPSAGARPVAGCNLFPANNYWHADVSDLPVHDRSDAWVRSIGLDAGLKADFGSGTWAGHPIGIPTNVVSNATRKHTVRFDYADESDRRRYPIPARPRIEGGGDRHLLTVNRDTCRLNELYAVRRVNGRWRAGSGASWSLRSNALRPAGWTSADAAGLPILPGLVRWQEVAAGRIDHAIRFTAPESQDGYIWPARHEAGDGGPNVPPMGAWFRLKDEVDISGFHGPLRVILEALKRHGMILADNGSPWYLSGVPDPHWDNDVLNSLDEHFTGRDFEAVDTRSMRVSPDSGAVAP
jgi:hypothetical protein